MMRNWEAEVCPATSSPEIWRNHKQTEFQHTKRSSDASLGRTIVALMDDQWANQVPIDSGLLGGGTYLDLAR